MGFVVVVDFVAGEPVDLVGELVGLGLVVVVAGSEGGAMEWRWVGGTVVVAGFVVGVVEGLEGAGEVVVVVVVGRRLDERGLC